MPRKKRFQKNKGFTSVIIILLVIASLGLILAYLGKLTAQGLWVLTILWCITAIILFFYKREKENKNIFLKQK